ncbi:NYN domain-containing protein [Janibacter cremeus]|uniref:NYN domain-containing protein n=1 Tax=Janibacter cremeus TaxID=1285192 RepID=UPI0023FA28C3|nr:NYN domain-containing protein [Janibacter cremeus]WEV79104.1 NYN domain-containing protein [Janibacter cremeus]
MDADASTSTRIAVLIDCDNVSSKHTSAVLEELAKYGTPTVKRAYGDWTTTQLGGWKGELQRNAIQPVQQFAYTVGKNSTDSALIIDAMDLLWQGHVEAFALVSSDSDFTRLATRLRESGKRVYGLGMRKTPESLRRAVDQFIYLELLQDQSRDEADGEDEGTSTTPSGDHEAPGTAINLQSALTKAINATSGDDGWSTLGTLGQHLSRAHADFDPRAFGHQKLSTLVEEQPYLETSSKASTIRVRLRTRRSGNGKSAKASTSGKTPTGKSAAKKTTARKSAPGTSTKA